MSFKKISLLCIIGFSSFAASMQQAKPLTLSDLPKDVLHNIVARVLRTHVPQLMQLTPDNIKALEQDVQFANTHPDLVAQSSDDRKERYATTLNKVIMQLTQLFSEILSASNDIFESIKQAVLPLLFANKQFSTTFAQEIIPMILQAITDQLKNNYVFKNATIMHTALLLSDTRAIRQWLKNNSALYTQFINTPTDNAFMLTPLSLAHILLDQELVNLLKAQGAHIAPSYINEQIQQNYENSLQE